MSEYEPDLHPSELDAIRMRAKGEWPTSTDVLTLLAYVDRLKAREDATWNAGYASAENYLEHRCEDAWEEGYRQAAAYEGEATLDPEELASNPYRDEDCDPAEIDKLRAIVDRVRRLVEEWPEDPQRRVQAKKQWIAVGALRTVLTDGEGTHGLRKLADDYAREETPDA